MTAGEVADLLRTPLSTVYGLARRGRIPAHRIGRRWRFVRREIEEWLLASRPERAAERRRAPLPMPGSMFPEHPRPYRASATLGLAGLIGYGPRRPARAAHREGRVGFRRGLGLLGLSGLSSISLSERVSQAAHSSCGQPSSWTREQYTA